MANAGSCWLIRKAGTSAASITQANESTIPPAARPASETMDGNRKGTPKYLYVCVRTRPPLPGQPGQPGRPDSTVVAGDRGRRARVPERNGGGVVSGRERGRAPTAALPGGMPPAYALGQESTSGNPSNLGAAVPCFVRPECSRSARVMGQRHRRRLKPRPGHAQRRSIERPCADSRCAAPARAGGLGNRQTATSVAGQST